MRVMTFVALVVCFGLAGMGAATAQQKPSGTMPASFAADAPRIEAFLRKMLGHRDVRVAVGTDGRKGTVMVGGKAAGTVGPEDEDDNDTFIWELMLPAAEVVAGGKVDAGKVGLYLSALLASKTVESRPSSDDGPNVSVGELSGAVSPGAPGQDPILSFLVDRLDLPPTTASVAAAIQPVAGAAFFARWPGVKVRGEPSADAPEVATLAEHDRITVNGKGARVSDERWYRFEGPDGKPRFVLEADLLSPELQERKLRYRMLAPFYPTLLAKVAGSKGDLAKYMGFYTLGPDCATGPGQVKKVANFERAMQTAQQARDLFWATTSWVLWSDGSSVFRATVDLGRIERFQPMFVREAKFPTTGPVQVYHLARVEPPGTDPDLAVAGFAEGGKLLLGMEFNGKQAKWRFATRCNNLVAVQEAVPAFYKDAADRLQID